MAQTWKRPESVPHPSVWEIYEGPRAFPNGQKPRFRIQDLTDDLIEDVVIHMKTHFIVDEPHCKCLGLAKDKVAVEETSGAWRMALQYHVGLVALLDNADELEDKTLPKIAGCNLTFPIFPDTVEPELESPKIRSILNLVNMVSHKVDCFEKYNVPVIMYALGLSVDPIYRGQLLGEKILRARFPLGRAIGIPLTTTVFTAHNSKHLARKVGFEVVAEFNSEEYKEDGVQIFKDVDNKIIELMAARIL